MSWAGHVNFLVFTSFCFLLYLGRQGFYGFTIVIFPRLAPSVQTVYLPSWMLRLSVCITAATFMAHIFLVFILAVTQNIFNLFLECSGHVLLLLLLSKPSLVSPLVKWRIMLGLSLGSETITRFTLLDIYPMDELNVLTSEVSFKFSKGPLSLTSFDDL